jgi:hypothetical protein
MSTELIKLIHKQILSVAYQTDQMNTRAKKNSTIRWMNKTNIS